MADVKCKWCGEPMTGAGPFATHIDGYYGCYGSKPRDPITYAEPAAPGETKEESEK